MAGRAGKMAAGSTFGNMAAGTTPETMALWGLVGLELLAQFWLRHYFRAHHGG